jgi:hypothetical protein
MLASLALIAALVVPSDARHELLRVSTAFLSYLLFKIFGVTTSKGRCQTAMMKDFDLAAFSHSKGEPKVVRFRRVRHFGALRVATGLLSAA